MNRPYLRGRDGRIVAVISQPTLHTDFAPDLELEAGIAALRSVEMF